MRQRPVYRSLQRHHMNKQSDEAATTIGQNERDGRARQIQIIRAMAMEQRWRVAQSLNATAREWKACALRASHPDWSEAEIKKAVRRSFLDAGRESYSRVFIRPLNRPGIEYMITGALASMAYGVPQYFPWEEGTLQTNG
jgi:hypothetical protein